MAQAAASASVMMERSISGASTTSSSTTSSSDGPPTPPPLRAATTCLDWAVTRLLLDDGIETQAKPIDIPSPRPHPHALVAHGRVASDAPSLDVPASNDGRDAYSASSTQLLGSFDIAGFSVASNEVLHLVTDQRVESTEETTLERLERVVFLESDDDDTSFESSSSSASAIIVRITSVTNHQGSPVHLTMQPPASSAPGPARTRLRAASITQLECESGSSSVVSILASALPTTTAATVGPAFGIVFGAVAGGSGNLFNAKGASTKTARNAYGAPDLNVYLARDFGSTNGRTNRKRMQEQKRREREEGRRPELQLEREREKKVEVIQQQQQRKPELRRHTVTGQRSDHVRSSFEALSTVVVPRELQRAPATPPTRALRNRALKFAHTPPVIPRVASSQRLLLERLAEALGSNVHASGAKATPSDIERMLDSNTSRASDSFTSAFASSGSNADTSDASGIVASSKTAQALRAAAGSTCVALKLGSGLGKAWEPNETLPRSPSLSPPFNIASSTSAADVAAQQQQQQTNPIRSKFGQGQARQSNTLRSAAWGDAEDSNSAPPRRQARRSIVGPGVSGARKTPMPPPPAHSTPPRSQVQLQAQVQQATHAQTSSQASNESTAAAATTAAEFRKPKRLRAACAARPVSTTALSLLDCWADFSGVWSADPTTGAEAESVSVVEEHGEGKERVVA